MPQDAVEQWFDSRELAEPDRRVLAVALTVLDRDDDVLASLTLLNDWAADGCAVRRTAGVFGFLRAAYRRGEPDRPLILSLTGHDPAIATVVAGLWGWSLITPGAGDAVRTVLRSWAAAAERDPEVRDTFVRLFAAVPRSTRQAGLLMIHAEKLRSGRAGAPDTARRLLDVLTKGSW
ncbi:hypothetical protein [Actinoplanes couchii]|uniref:Uncharacterized protein n=1 Tax=Actinoplanes couchii TaxID=403638 RepID=A0ABQ3X3X5_9ACTN|nr:hypothetical protein [Actinoplanes couchii]MDR6322943.1 hypothetical protein [Actinoplanes couchii]GID53183.1 hypothetical protein Aco03nite_015870 [Actinoplanes couchii]